MAFTKVAIAGATGRRIGTPILDALVETGKFSITVLSRHANDGSFPSDITVVEVDYDSIDSVTTALKGQDVVISALSTSSLAPLLVLIEAAAQAGVKRVIPAEYGSDTFNPLTAKLPVMANKKGEEKLCEELAAKGKVTYTLVISGPFLDVGLEMGFLGVDVKKRQLNYFDGGNTKFSTTTTRGVARAVVEVLLHPEETENRAVYVQEAALTQRELLRLTQEALGDDGWTEVDAGSTADLEKSSFDKFAQGQNSMAVFVGLLQCAFFREGYGGLFSQSKLDNELLGVKALTEKEIVRVVRAISKAF